MKNKINTNLNIRIPLIILLFFPMFSCKEKDKIKPRKETEVISATIELRADYRYQIFYDLETGKEVSANLKTVWDLGFETSSNGYHLILNSSKKMQVYNTKSTNFSSVKTVPTTEWTWDEPNGSMSATAIGEWANLIEGNIISKKEVYIIDIGYNHLGEHLGHKKLIIEGLEANEYKLRFADLDGANENTYTIAKDSNYNFSFFSFTGGGKSVIVEPKKEDWDLVFTQYTHVFHDGTAFPTFLVTGVLQNTNKTQVAVDNLVGFSNYTYENVVDSSAFNRARNTIGYTWKEYNYADGAYTVSPNKNYIIKGEQDFLYKLRFISFYNNKGEAGTISVEYKQL